MSVRDDVRGNAFVVSAAGSGHGKTLVMLALVRALVAANLRVQPYKIGPDYIDARFYARVAGRPAYNLDLTLDGTGGVQALVAATRGDADVVLCEGMMGLFDGADDGTGSTADVARALGARVILVLDCCAASQTAAAVALGLRSYDPSLEIAGVVLNRVGGEAHARAVREACARAGITVLATVRSDAAFEAADRRLGLDPAAVERRALAVERLALELGESLALMRVFPQSGATASRAFATYRSSLRGRARARVRHPAAPRIAYAQDDAFWFTYAETLDALRLAGADVVPFSPLRGRRLPPRTRGVWIGGGYPEDFAAQLEANASMRAALASALGAGMPCYAECGGMMYLAESLENERGTFAMVGALAGSTSIAKPVLHMGYREARVVADTPLDLAGTRVKGYEFHYATARLAEPTHAYEFDDAYVDGAIRNNVIAGFLHRHFLPESAPIARFVAACAAQEFS